LIKASLGIYPTEAVHTLVPHLSRCKPFDVDAEVDAIEQAIIKKHAIAVGETGLDGFHLDASTFVAQERVFERLIEVACRQDVPVIVHSRKRESRCLEILAHHGAKRVDMHCYMGKVKQAVDYALKFGWCFSIPAILPRTESFQKLVELLPPTSILTETDGPYLSLVPKTRNEPLNVVNTVSAIAKLRQWDDKTAQQVVWDNYSRLFGVT
jgi:TatD DNase family protein